MMRLDTVRAAIAYRGKQVMQIRLRGALPLAATAKRRAKEDEGATRLPGIRLRHNSHDSDEQ